MMVKDYIRPAAVKAEVLKMHGGQPHYEGIAVTRFGFHNLRHGIATWLAEQGTDPVVIQRMLRHSTTDMTMHYVHASKQARKAQEQFLEKFLPEDCGGTSRVQ